MKEYLEIGQIVNTNGIKGFLKIKPLTDDVTRFEKLKTVYIQKNKELLLFNIQEVKYNNSMVLLKLEGIDDINEAENFKNSYIKIAREYAVELEKNSYFIVDIIDCEVFTDENEYLGKVVDVFKTGSNDVYTVKTMEKKEILIPAIQDVIKNIDIENKKIVVHLMDGLI